MLDQFKQDNYKKQRSLKGDLENSYSLIENKIFELVYKSFSTILINPIQDGIFRGLFTDGGSIPLPKICHTHPTMIKLGTVIRYLQAIQKIHKSYDTPIEFNTYFIILLVFLSL